MKAVILQVDKGLPEQSREENTLLKVLLGAKLEQVQADFLYSSESGDPGPGQANRET